MSTSKRPILQQQLIEGLTALGLVLPQTVIQQLLDYLDVLVRWNKTYNLTAIRDLSDMVTRHLLDSLAILPYVRGTSLADIGSGAGLPGIPLALALPSLSVSLIEANGKKARFLREVVRQLKLSQVLVVENRVEDVAGTFNCITARAFATLADMLNGGGHLLAPAGEWLALKGRLDDDELKAIPAAFTVAAVHRLAVPGLDAERHVVIIKRVNS